MNAILLGLILALGDPDAEALEKFKADCKGKDIPGRAACVEELSKTQSPKICARLAALLVTDATEVRVAAAKGLMLQPDDKKHAIPFLLNGATANAKNPPVLAAIVASLGKLRDEQGAAEVNKHVNAEDTDLAKTAIEAAGEIRSASSFDPLIKALKDCEETLKPRDKNNPGGGFGGGLGRMNGPGANSGKTFKELRDRANALKPEIIKVLRDMAKVSCEDAKDWEDWWKEHKGTWKSEKS